MKIVDFYYSIGSRYSYLASTQIDALKQETGCHVEWHPINSVQLMARRKTSPFNGIPVSGQYEWSYRELDAKRWANLDQVPYDEPRGRVKFDSELLAQSCIVAKQFGKVEEYSYLLFTAMFHGSISKVIDVQACVVIAEICGISATDFHAALNTQATISQLDPAISSAVDAGIFGVPTFVTSGELFWGNDRIILLRQHLMFR